MQIPTHLHHPRTHNYPSRIAMTLNYLEGKARMEWEHDEAELVWAAQAGNLAAFDELVRRYRPAAMLTARGILPNRELADDAVQDAFIAAYKSLPQLSDSTRLGSWIFSIVRHRSLRIRSGERVVHLPIDEFIASYVPSIQQKMEDESDQVEVRCAVRQLPEELRAIVQLYYLNDWSVRAIAEYLALPNTTVKWRLHAGRNQLRALLSEQMEEQK
ncbi:MAG: sigma-70 family RNA polymerase sigma factor [Chlorobia bacterium]|nr:sigma-70 family RNA polymerase sigma factor [Fimbriimonadaceae bacterium]